MSRMATRSQKQVNEQVILNSEEPHQIRVSEQ